MLKRIPGTKDILPEEIAYWQRLEKISRDIFSVFNYQEIRPPLIEPASLFNRSLGESTEIIQKQMFIIQNKEDLYALRPEATASIVRAYIENNLDRVRKFAKLYYIGPMFRLERPQKGRLRQFHHIGAEAIGSCDPNLDVEVLSLVEGLLKGFSIKDYKIKINSLGCAKDRKNLKQILEKSLKGGLSKLCVDCKARFKKNILRILDCKQTACQEIINGLDIEEKYLCSDCDQHFAAVKKGLDSLGIAYEIAPYLVRGLDYYTRTVFEITHKDLGAQDALGAGGRYDNLVSELSGPDVGAIGFALGVERLLLVSRIASKMQREDLVYLITLGEKAKKEGAKLLSQLRSSGIACDTDYENKSIKGALRAANDLGARFVVIIGDDELKKNVVTLKDMNSGTQEEVRIDGIISKIKLNLKPKT
ncbi:MAG: histidine--tRNA ligase [Candidatus Omnitrophota bacterium]